MNIQLIAIKTLQLLLCLSLLIVLHEGGHFGFAKLFKVRVEKFFMFFDYKFHLFSTRDNWFTRLFPRFKSNETEYGIGWIPLGGYVKISGMVDESLDTEQLKQPAKPDEFRSQKVWKRFLIMVGGVLMNVITAMVIYCGIMFFVGEDRLPMENIKQGFAFNEEAETLGFRDGDIPVELDGQHIKGWSPRLFQSLSNAQTVTVLRAGKKVSIAMPDDGLNLIEIMEMVPPFMTPVAPAVVEVVSKDSPAAKAGLKSGCHILSVNGSAITYWSDYDSLYVRKMDVLAAKGCTHADSVKLRVMHMVFQNPNASRPDTVTFQLDENYLMGVIRSNVLANYKVDHIDYNLLTCIPAGLKYGWETLKNYVDSFKYIATPKGAQSVGSFLSIGDLFPDSWDWLRFWSLTAFISIALAVMNILPIPGLDGGHVVLLLYEAITGKQPSEKVMLWLEYIGMACLIALMVLAFGNDIRRFFF